MPFGEALLSAASPTRAAARRPPRVSWYPTKRGPMARLNTSAAEWVRRLYPRDTIGVSVLPGIGDDARRFALSFMALGASAPPGVVRVYWPPKRRIAYFSAGALRLFCERHATDLTLGERSSSDTHTRHNYLIGHLPD